MDILHIDELGIQKAIISAATDIIGGTTVDDDYIIGMWEMKVISASVSLDEKGTYKRIQDAIDYIRERGTGDTEKDDKNTRRLMSAAIRVGNNHETDCDDLVEHMAYINRHGANVEEMKEALFAIGNEIGRRECEGYKSVTIEHIDGKIHVIGKAEAARRHIDKKRLLQQSIKGIRGRNI